jgi:hypothetical protein
MTKGPWLRDHGPLVPGLLRSGSHAPVRRAPCHGRYCHSSDTWPLACPEPVCGRVRGCVSARAGARKYLPLTFPSYLPPCLPPSSPSRFRHNLSPSLRILKGGRRNSRLLRPSVWALDAAPRARLSPPASRRRRARVTAHVGEAAQKDERTRVYTSTRVYGARAHANMQMSSMHNDGKRAHQRMHGTRNKARRHLPQ